ncbi:MAG: hypothetical protein L6Q99_09410 [Planctomycetes bacterium]|nr:hypothetical protein [Planctomycetota bacterium]
MKLVRTLLCSLALPGSALANTWIVDAAGGGDFTDLPQAIAASVQGDVLFVLPGNYSAFALDKRLVIVGQGPGVKVNGLVRVHDVNTGSTTALVDLQVHGVDIENCSRPVVLDGITSTSRLSIDACTDVRLARCDVQLPGAFGDGDAALGIADARVEISDSVLRGRDGFDCHCCVSGFAGWGGSAVVVAGNSYVGAYGSNLLGGDGGDATGACCDLVGDGGDGINSFGLATVLVAGLPVHSIDGGLAGAAACGFGTDGSGLWSNDAVRVSGATIDGISSPSIDFAVPADPTLTLLGTPVHGNVITFRVDAEPGATVDLIMGRFATIAVTPGLVEDQLVLQQRVFHLGTVGASGHADFNFPVPASLPSGFTFFAQAKVSFSASDVRYSNSTPTVIR